MEGLVLVVSLLVAGSHVRAQQYFRHTRSPELCLMQSKPTAQS